MSDLPTDTSQEATPSRLDWAALRRIERAVDRFETAWREGEPITLEELLDAATARAERDELLKYALAVELPHRRRLGETPKAREYERRFPDHTGAIRRAFAEEPTVSVQNATDGSFLDQLIHGPSPAFEPEPLPEAIGKFTVLGRLGRGGQGSAFLARDPDLGGLVVLKRYHGSAHDQEALADGQALRRIRSRHTPQCYSLERLGEALFLVMEYIPGRNL